MAGNRIEQLDGVGVACQLLLPLFFDKAEVDGFLVTQAGQLAAHAKRAALVLGTQFGRDGRQRLGGRQVVVADHAGHFFDQIFFQIDVKAERRSRDRNHAFRSHRRRQTQAVQCVQTLLLSHRHADDLDRTGHAQLHDLGDRHIGLVVVHDAHLRLGRAADFQHQGRDALDMLGGELGVHTALEAVTGVGREIEVARAACDRLGEPERGFDVDVLRVVGHGRGVAAHDAGQRFDFLVIGNHADLDEVIDLDGVTVEQLERLALFAPAHIQAAADLVQIEDMAGTAQLEHHVIGDVHQGRHAALAAAGQTVQHPLGCLHLRVDIAHDAAREATAQIGGFNLDGQLVLRSHSCSGEAQSLQRRAGQRRQLACHTIDAQAVRQIGRELEGEQRVVQIQVLAHILAQGRIGGEFQQAAGVFVNAQLLGRAQHAKALHAAQLADLDLEGLAIGTGRQLGAHGGARDPDAHARVRCAADDVQQLGAAHIHLADAQTVGVGMLRGFLDFTDHDAGEGRRHRIQLFHFQTGHGQGIGQLLGGQVGVAVFAQPGFRKLHSQTLGRSGQLHRRRSATGWACVLLKEELSARGA